MKSQKPVKIYSRLEEVPLEWIQEYPSSARDAFNLYKGKFFDAQPCTKGHYSLKNQSRGQYKGCVTCSELKQREKTLKQAKDKGLLIYDLDAFLKDAREKHKTDNGEPRYNYSLIREFRNKTDEYWIVCPNCCCFLQKASKHLSGQGCGKCNLKEGQRRRRLTQEQYIIRCQETHKDKYDLSSISYELAHAFVTPTCRVEGHGIFQTEANNFMRGRSGCQLCAALTTSERCRSSKEEFIKSSQKVHGINKYNYDLVVYTTSTKKIAIHCPLPGHGLFMQTPSSHLNGNGCPDCGLLARASTFAMTLDDFLKQSREKHGDFYDYSKVVLGDLCGEKSRGHTAVTITCPVHGDFEQAPLVHFKSGCRKCHMEYLWNEVRAIGRKEWVERCQIVHSNKYNYSKVHQFDKILDEEVVITCPVEVHGDFRQSARIHLSGSGCQKCGDLNRGRDSYLAFLSSPEWAAVPTELYLVEVFSQFYKFGISVDFDDRARSDYTAVFYRRELERAEAWVAEQYLLLSTEWARPGSLPSDVNNWGGSTELRNKDFDPTLIAEEMDSVVELIQEIGWKEFYKQHFG